MRLLPNHGTLKNRILASLPKAEISRLAPHLSPLDLPSGKTLLNPGQETTYAYFLETGMASVVVAMADGNMVETGITGNDGLVGFPALLGTKSTPTRTFMQIPGKGFRIKAQRLSDEFERSGALRKKIHRYFQAHWCSPAKRLPAIVCMRLRGGWRDGYSYAMTAWKPMPSPSRMNSWATCWERRAPQ